MFSLSFNFIYTKMNRYHGFDGSQAKVVLNCWRWAIKRIRAIADTKSNFSIQTIGSSKLNRWWKKTKERMNVRLAHTRPVLYKRIYLLLVSLQNFFSSLVYTKHVHILLVRFYSFWNAIRELLTCSHKFYEKENVVCSCV